MHQVSRGLSVATLAGFTGGVLLQGGACVSGNGTVADTAATGVQSSVVSELLASVGSNVIEPTLQNFVADMEALDSALVVLLDDIDAGEDWDESTSTVQSAFLEAMATWQQLEVMQVGPSASALDDAAGENIRDEIYSWPTLNGCRVDQETTESAWNETSFFVDNLVNAYGMDAMEHLLFSGPDTTCSSQVPPVSDGSWEQLGEAGVARNRSAYARTLGGEVVRQAEYLLDSWSADGGDFSGLLSDRVEAGPYENKQAALTAVFHALFYLDSFTKDNKLAGPMGQGSCGEMTCPDELEGTASERSLDSIVANVIGFEKLFTGGQGVGFDDFLLEFGHGGLAEQILADIDAFLVLAESFEGTLYEGISSGSDGVEQLYDALSKVTTSLKGDMVTVLSLTVPAEASGDND